MQTITDNGLETLKSNSHLSFDNKVLEKIAAINAQDIDGLLGMEGSMVDSLAETFNQERQTKGIKAEVGEHQVAIDMNALLEYDADAQAIFDTLCAKLADAIDRMTGLQLVELNLHINDVLTRREWQQTTK
ncbi:MULTISPECIES: Asp23/Gls24 family envelope stress response protein [Lacticaseibacillus]|uniref:Stress response regulator gls24 homolog n=2 Tax=Lacticaseibacillus TaxID=2759736 RepID=A0ABW4CL55_9LACO|nr:MULTISPECIES: Asp23/Gls24 family envelope stress response protein [Lacticaseibacillus]